MSTREIRGAAYSASYTITLDPPPAAPASAMPERVIHIIVRCKTKLEDLTQRFESIFNRYSTWQDPLSQRIRTWGSYVILDLATHEDSEEGGMAKLREHIQALARELLFDPIGMVTMQEPIFVREMVLDRETAVRNIVLDRETWDISNDNRFRCVPYGRSDVLHRPEVCRYRFE